MPSPSEDVTVPGDGAPGPEVFPDPIDAGPDAPRCYVEDPFIGTTKLTQSTDSVDSAPKLTPDERQMVFISQSSTTNSWDLFTARRNDTSVPFGSPIRFEKANSTALEGDVAMTADANRVYFTSNRNTADSKFRLFMTTRTDGIFPAAVELSIGHVSGKDDLTVALSWDEKHLYFSSNRAEVDNIYSVELNASGIPTGPVLIDGPLQALGTRITRPSFTRDGLVVYFTSDRIGGKGLGDIWYSTRGTIAAPWTSPKNVGELNTEFQQDMGFISNDLCRIYWARATNTGLAGVASMDMYVASRRPR